MTKAQNKEQQEAIVGLRETLPPGTKVYTVLRSVSRSGMMRRLDVVTFDKDGTRLWLTHLVAKALGWSFDQKTETVRVQGRGLDVGFHLVNCLSYALHGHAGKGVKPDEEGRPLTPTRRHYRAGYSLRHEWI
jgi:hypothetical protein